MVLRVCEPLPQGPLSPALPGPALPDGQKGTAVGQLCPALQKRCRLTKEKAVEEKPRGSISSTEVLY